MAYLVPSEFVSRMVDAGASKIHMSTRDTLIRAYMAGAILALHCSARCCFRSAFACSTCSDSTC
jgi:formate/nitrite transporter FocA (FNT family)